MNFNLKRGGLNWLYSVLFITETLIFFSTIKLTKPQTPTLKKYIDI